jgi:hypothetical protein
MGISREYKYADQHGRTPVKMAEGATLFRPTLAPPKTPPPPPSSPHPSAPAHAGIHDIPPTTSWPGLTRPSTPSADPVTKRPEIVSISTIVSAEKNFLLPPTDRSTGLPRCWIFPNDLRIIPKMTQKSANRVGIYNCVFPRFSIHFT